jgi:hypothetical protein
LLGLDVGPVSSAAAWPWRSTNALEDHPGREVEAGQSIAHEIASVDRDERITPATLWLSIAEGKSVFGAIRARLVWTR